MKSKVRITVVKIFSAENLYGKDVPAASVPEMAKLCPKHKEGQVFIVDEDGYCPANFCGWAFADIQRDITHLRFGGDFPNLAEKGVNLACCTDAFRPVVFRLERI